MNSQIVKTFKFYEKNTNAEQLSRTCNDLALECKNNENVKTEVYSSLFIQSFKQCFNIVKKYNWMAKDDTVIISVFQEALIEALAKWDNEKAGFTTFLYRHFNRKVNSQIVGQRRIWKNPISIKDFVSFEGYTHDKIGFDSLVKTLKITKKEKRFLWYVYLGYSFDEVAKLMNITNYMYYTIRKNLKNKLNILDFIENVSF